MKTKIYLGLICIFFAGFNSVNAQANRVGETMIGFGVGYSNFNSYLYYGAQPSLELPELSATLDYFVISNYSIGLGVAYQSVSGGGNFYSYPNTTSFTENVNRVNVSLRSVVYFTKDTKPEFYGGVCIGYEYFNYQYNPTPNVGNYPNYGNNNQPLTAPTIQAFLGVRAMITPAFGTYFEVGTGIPFFAEMGFSFSLGGKPADATPVQGPTGPSPYVR